MSERKKGPLMKAYRCKDRKSYQYGKRCTDAQLSGNGNLCMTGAEQLCHISYPVSDWKKHRSEDAVCRTVPQDYIDGEYDYFGIGSTNTDRGLCSSGCEGYDNDNKCAMSWPEGETRFLNPKAMYRCVPKDE